MIIISQLTVVVVFLQILHGYNAGKIALKEPKRPLKTDFFCLDKNGYITTQIETKRDMGPSGLSFTGLKSGREGQYLLCAPIPRCLLVRLI